MWTIVSKKLNNLPYDRPFIAYWRNHICLMQYSKDMRRFVASVYPVQHLQLLELKQREVADITHWMELPREPLAAARERSSHIKIDKPLSQGISYEKVPAL